MLTSGSHLQKESKLLFPDVQQTFTFTTDIILTEKYSGVYSAFLVVNAEIVMTDLWTRGHSSVT